MQTLFSYTTKKTRENHLERSSNQQPSPLTKVIVKDKISVEQSDLKTSRRGLESKIRGDLL